MVIVPGWPLLLAFARRRIRFRQAQTPESAEKHIIVTRKKDTGEAVDLFKKLRRPVIRAYQGDPIDPPKPLPHQEPD
jgi:hypothetical protein